MVSVQVRLHRIVDYPKDKIPTNRFVGITEEKFVRNVLIREY